MEKRRRALLLDTDPDTLITLQHALEVADIDTTVTWDEVEASQLIETTPFDLLLLGDHPPELNAVAILDDLSLRGNLPTRFDFEGNLRQKRCRVLSPARCNWGGSKTRYPSGS